MSRQPNKSRWCFLRSSDALRDAVKYKMMKTGKTQQQIAAFLGINDARISRYLKGYTRGCISQSQLLMLCDYLGISVQLNISVNNV